MTKSGYLKKYRNPLIVIKIAIFLHFYLPSRIVPLFLFILFRVKVSHKAVCEWTNKFGRNINLPEYKNTNDKIICHADEKYVKVCNFLSKILFRKSKLWMEHSSRKWQRWNNEILQQRIFRCNLAAKINNNLR